MTSWCFRMQGNWCFVLFPVRISPATVSPPREQEALLQIKWRRFLGPGLGSGPGPMVLPKGSAFVKTTWVTCAWRKLMSLWPLQRPGNRWSRPSLFVSIRNEAKWKTWSFYQNCVPAPILRIFRCTFGPLVGFLGSLDSGFSIVCLDLFFQWGHSHTEASLQGPLRTIRRHTFDCHTCLFGLPLFNTGSLFFNVFVVESGWTNSPSYGPE